MTRLSRLALRGALVCQLPWLCALGCGVPLGCGVFSPPKDAATAAADLVEAANRADDAADRGCDLYRAGVAYGAKPAPAVDKACAKRGK